MKLSNPIKTDNPAYPMASCLLRWPTLCGVCFSVECVSLWNVFLSTEIHFLPLNLSLIEFFLWWDIKKVNCIKVLRPCVWSVSKPWVQVPIWVALFHNPYRFCTLAIMRVCNLKSHVKCWLNPLIGSTKNIFLITLISLGEGNGNPLQYSCLENPVDGGAW